MPKITLENGKVVEISRESYDALARAVQEKRWKPFSGEYYYYVTDNGDVNKDYLRDDVYDKLYNFNHSQRNVFKTQDEAEKHLEYLKALAILKDDAEDWEPDWSDNYQYKWEVFYNWSDDGLEASSTFSCQFPMQIYFETREQAERSIDIHRKEWLTVFGVEK